jgi:hypothetical protein
MRHPQLVPVKDEIFGSHDNSYDRNAFITKVGDDKGEPIRFRLGAGMIAEVQRLIQQQRIPEYKTYSDFYRDAVYHRMHDIEQMSGLADVRRARALSTQSLIDKAEKRMAAMEEEIAVVKTARDTLQKALGYRDWLQFDDHLRDCKEAVDGMVGKYKDEMMALIALMEAERGKAQ